MKFSVLLSVHEKEIPGFLDRALESIWREQTRKPDEIVLVEDGPLEDAHYRVIEYWLQEIGDSLKTIPLSENVGISRAKNIGLQECSHDIVAIMDTDDVAIAERFEKQMEIFENGNIDLCSAWVAEFENGENDIYAYRTVPKTHDEIVQFSRYRSPINHPATIFRKSIALSVGGYEFNGGLCDYHFCVKMIMAGAKCHNIQEPLVKMRAGKGLVSRRSGFRYALSDLKLQKKFLDMGFLNRRVFVTNCIVRVVVRLAPKSIVKAFYDRIRRI